jgi:hypothetical protein
MKFSKKISYSIVLTIINLSSACSIPNNSIDNISNKSELSNKNNKFQVKGVSNQTSDGYNETAYLLAFPDIASAVSSGSLANGYAHYNPYGKNEGRLSNPNYITAKNSVIYEGFDPKTYLNTFQDLKNAFGSNNYAAAYTHYLDYGKNEGRLSNPGYIAEKLKMDFNEKAYLLAFPTVKQAIREGQFVNAYDHFILVGNSQSLLNNPTYISILNDMKNNNYNEEAYLLAFPDIASAVSNGIIPNGYAHYNPYGKNEGRLSNQNYISQVAIFDDMRYYGYNEEAYLIAFPDVANAVKNGSLPNGYAHFNPYGKNEGRLNRAEYKTVLKDVLDGYEEKTYLIAFPDVAGVVQSGALPNGYAHFNPYGKNEGRMSYPIYKQTLAGQQFSPLAPVNITKTNMTFNSITLTWQQPIGALKYKVYRVVNGVDTLIDGNVTSTSYTFTGLNQNTSYTLKIIATNSKGDSPKSQITTSTSSSSINGSVG